MTGWIIFNVALSITVFGLLAYELLVMPERLPIWERVGVGILGAGCLLTVAPILFHEPTPFEDWAASLLRVGVAIFFFARMTKHAAANRAMVRAARRHKRKGKA